MRKNPNRHLKWKNRTELQEPEQTLCCADPAGSRFLEGVGDVRGLEGATPDKLRP